MAGFMTVLAAPMFRAFAGRVVNTHPSLLPAFPGAHAVRDALAAGVKVTGCTVHVATEQVDHGPILAQEAVAVLPTDTEASLHERIKDVERRLYPQAIKELLRMSETALLSVFDKTGDRRAGRGPARARLASWCRAAARPRRWPRRASP